MVIKYAVLKQESYESGKIYIAPAMVLDNEVLAHDRARFNSQAYGVPHLVLELRPIERVK